MEGSLIFRSGRASDVLFCGYCEERFNEVAALWKYDEEYGVLILRI